MLDKYDQLNVEDSSELNLFTPRLSVLSCFRKMFVRGKSHETIYVYYFLSNKVYRHSTPKFITSRPSKSEVWPCLLKSTLLKYWKYAQTYPYSLTCSLFDSRLPC